MTRAPAGGAVVGILVAGGATLVILLLAWVVLLFVLGSPAGATLPGGNGGLAFSAYETNEANDGITFTGQVVGIAPLHGRRRRVADGSAPSFSPEGRRIAYDGRDGIWLTRPGCRWPKESSRPPACSRLRQIARGDAYFPTWSPSGRRVAFERNLRIYQVGIRGGRPRFLVDGLDPDWSSRGEIAFVRPEPVTPDGIAVRGRDGAVRTLTQHGSEPSWSPTGKRLAFASPQSSPPGIYLVDADGGGVRRIAGGFAARAPTWSPNGRLIAYTNASWGFVNVVRPNGTGVRQLMPRLSSGFIFDALAWQPLS